MVLSAPLAYFAHTYGQATINSNTVATSTIVLTDGQPGDDTVADGTIIDPSGPATSQQKSTLGDWVWYDVNGDGIKDTGEQGINGVLVELYEVTFPGGVTTTTFITSMLTGPDSVAIDSDDTLTGEAGAYDFTIENNKVYQVVISTTNFLPGGVLENYVYTGENATNAYNGPEPRIVPIGGTVVDYNDADFPFWLPPSLEVDKQYNGVGDARVGETISFTIRITNTGGITITTLPLEDRFNNIFLSYQSASTNPDNPTDDGVLNWTNLAPAGGLPPSATVSVDVFFEALADTTVLSAVAPCTQNGHTPNMAEVMNAVADPDGVGPQPAVPVPDDLDCDSVEILHPTGIDLAESGVLQTSDGVLVQWTTESESDIVGFYIWKTSGVDTDLRSGEMITAKNVGQSIGTSYEWLDAGATLDSSDVYLLEVVYDNGSSEQKVLNLSVDTSIFLPMITR